MCMCMRQIQTDRKPDKDIEKEKKGNQEKVSAQREKLRDERENES